MSVVATDRPTGRLRFIQPPLSPTEADDAALDAVPAGHKARTLLAALLTLDLTALLATYKGRGSSAFPPLPLLACALFLAHEGHPSPADWAKHARESLPARWLLRGLCPSRSAWYAFRDRLPAALLALAHQTVKTAFDGGLATADTAALDGTLVAADSTRHHLLNDKALQNRVHRIDDADGLYGPPAPAPGYVGKTPTGRARQRRHYSLLQKEIGRRKAANRARRASKRKADGAVRVSPGDPQAPLGLDKEKVYRPLYNVQLLADVGTALILTYQVVAQPNDAGLLGGLLGQAREGLGRIPGSVLADAGYAGGADLAAAEAEGVRVYAPWQSNDYSKPKKGEKYPKTRFTYQPSADAYECPAGQRLERAGTSRQQRSGPERVELTLYRAPAATCQECQQRAACTEAKGGRSISRGQDEASIQRLRERMEALEAKAKYRLRKQTVERLNADLKEHRSFRRLRGRGLARASAQAGLLIVAHNLITLHKLREQAGGGAAPLDATG